jgi:Fe-S-cluster containining protein
MAKKKKQCKPKESNKNLRVTLKDKLSRVYNAIDLTTTCQGKCECCKAACPSMNYCEFTQLIKEIWDKESTGSKIELVCTSIEYFFRYEFEKWGVETLIKPCMLLDKNNRCKYYESRPLSCRMYGLWPKEAYKKRVDKFEKAYEGLLKRKELPLNTQCTCVKRLDDSHEITVEIIEDLYAELDNIDRRVMKGFSEIQIKEKENYRSFHDWLLLKVFGEQWLSMLTSFMLAADRKTMEDQILELKAAVRENFSLKMPQIGS